MTFINIYNRFEPNNFLFFLSTKLGYYFVSKKWGSCKNKTQHFVRAKISHNFLFGIFPLTPEH